MAITLEVGTNSYVTIAEADSILEIYPEFTTWDALTDEEKSKLLIRATKNIEKIPFDLRKISTQILSFPLWWQNNIPDCVKESQTIEAVSLLGKSISDEENKISKGVLKLEEVREARKEYKSSFAKIYNGMNSALAYSLIKRYVKKTFSW